MSEPTERPGDEELYGVVRTVWEQRDPVPDGLVTRLQEAAALAAAGDLDVELMLLVERSEELVGTRGSGTAYTLRFAHDGVDLLLRVAEGRIDGWVVPPVALTVRTVRDGAPEGATESVVAVGDTGRFELTDLAPGLLRLRLEPADGSTAFLTPAFEI
jgi:hypothetical protein